MPDKDYPLSKEEFEAIYAKVPRLTVEVVLKNSRSEVYLTRRAIEPCEGQWHLPGGTVFFGEKLLDAVRRVALRELGVSVRQAELKGYIEYPSHYLHDLDSPVGIVFEVSGFEGEITPNAEASNGGWFARLPEQMHADQDVFLVENGYFKS